MQLLDRSVRPDHRPQNGRPVDIDPWRAMFSPTWRQQPLHALLACYEAPAFALAESRCSTISRPGAGSAQAASFARSRS